MNILGNGMGRLQGGYTLGLVMDQPVSRQQRFRDTGPLILLSLIVCLSAVRPGDAPWLNDEPKLMDSAFWYNGHPCSAKSYGIALPFTPAPFGLLGTRGVRYGPLPIWIDQIFLVFTHNLILMSAVRALCVNAITAASLYWLTKTLGFSPWLAIATMLSPWIWFYSRQLWDNSLCIPASALMLAAYADHLRTQQMSSLGSNAYSCHPREEDPHPIRRKPAEDRERGGDGGATCGFHAFSLHIAILCGISMALIHFMALAMVVPIGLHAVIRFRGVWKSKWSVALILLLATYISRPFWYFLIEHHPRDVPGGSSAWKGFFYPLLGVHHLSNMGLRNILGDEWILRFPRGVRHGIGAAAWLSAIVYPLCWTGMILSLPGVWQAISRWNRATLKDHLLLILLMVFVAQCGLDGYEHVYEGPHYFNATWVVYAIFAWLAASVLASLVSKRIQQIALCIFGSALLGMTTLIAVTVGGDSGIKSENYGTNLASQIEAATKLSTFSDDSPLDVQFDQWTVHPIEKSVLLKLIAPPAGERPKARLMVGYRKRWPSDAAIDVRDVPLRP